METKPPHKAAGRAKTGGSILYMVLIGIFIFGMLTLAISNYSKEQSNVLPRETEDNQINQMLTYTATIGQALDEMVIAGNAQRDTLYSNLDLSKPGDAGYQSGNHALELYYPTGGGITYQSASSDSGTPVASNYAIVPGAIIVGVGPTDATVGDVVFTTTIANATYCKRVNQIVNGSTTVPTMGSTAFTALFSTHATTTVDSTACASCVNMKQMCVTDGSSHYGFYAALYPG